MPKFKVREEGEFQWSEFHAFDDVDAAIEWAKHDFSECDGCHRDNGPYRVVVQGEEAGNCIEFEVHREFEPTFYAIRTGHGDP